MDARAFISFDFDHDGDLRTVQELNPKGRAYYPDIVAALVQRFNFQGYPTKPVEFDESKGIQFTDGKFSDGTLDRVQLFTHGIVLDTRVSTDVSAALLHDTLLWAKSELGLHYEESMDRCKQQEPLESRSSNGP